MSFHRITMTLDEPRRSHSRLVEAWRLVRLAIESGTSIVCEFYDAKSRAQERLYHSIFRDFAGQLLHPISGVSADAEAWKRLMVNAFWRATKDDPELQGEWAGRQPRNILSLDGTEFVSLDPRTSDFTKLLASNFITYLHAWGDSKGVRWSRTSLGRDFPDFPTH